jgi:hypothetical protein
MYNVHIVINLTVVIFLITSISILGLDMKEPYPRKLIQLFSEPYVRFSCYMGIYLVCLYNHVIGLLLALGLVLLHLDFLNLVMS